MKVKRVETGPLEFVDDWTGIFIRGDNAFSYALAVSDILLYLDKASPVSWMYLESLRKLLIASDMSNPERPIPQKAVLK